jgi:hypothetical protein
MSSRRTKPKGWRSAGGQSTRCRGANSGTCLAREALNSSHWSATTRTIPPRSAANSSGSMCRTVRCRISSLGVTRSIHQGQRRDSDWRRDLAGARRHARPGEGGRAARPAQCRPGRNAHPISRVEVQVLGGPRHLIAGVEIDQNPVHAAPGIVRDAEPVQCDLDPSVLEVGIRRNVHCFDESARSADSVVPVACGLNASNSLQKYHGSAGWMRK